MGADLIFVGLQHLYIGISPSAWCVSSVIPDQHQLQFLLLGYGAMGWVRFINVPPNTLQVIAGTSFYGSNEPINSVKAVKEGLASVPLPHHVTVICHICRWQKKQSNPENCKTYSSKCTQYNMNSSDNLPSYLRTNIIAQTLSVGGEEGGHRATSVLTICHNPVSSFKLHRMTIVKKNMNWRFNKATNHSLNDTRTNHSRKIIQTESVSDA